VPPRAPLNPDRFHATQSREVLVRLNKNVASLWDFDMLANDFETHLVIAIVAVMICPIAVIRPIVTIRIIPAVVVVWIVVAMIIVNLLHP
jgi:hypothetical protein